MWMVWVDMSFLVFVKSLILNLKRVRYNSTMLLAMDTATATASLAVYNLDTGTLLSEWTWQARRRQTQDLLATAQTMLAQLDLTPAQLTALAVTTGPGSFTGVRIAISAAKGIGLGLPAEPRVVGIPTLSVSAAPWLAPARASDPAACVCAYIRAGRGRYNWAIAPPGDAAQATSAPWRPTAAEHSGGTADEFAAHLRERTGRPIWLVGEPTPDLAAAMRPLAHVCLLDEVSALRRAGQLARLAAQQLATGTDETLATLQPFYLRAP